MDPVTLECSECPVHDTSGQLNGTQPGLCTHVPLELADEKVDRRSTLHDKCTTFKWNYLPSLSAVGRYCTCIKPKDPEYDQSVSALFIEDVDIQTVGDQPVGEQNVGEQTDEMSTDDQTMLDDPYLNECDEERNKYELWASDFEHGTFRIRECGIYKLMENVSLNMNAPSLSEYSTNDPDHLHWVPTEEQMADVDAYPSYKFIGAFSMGFFAGISVEADNVVIDLNGKELKMHHDFYLQQRFFSIIELGSKPFISGQGII